MTASRSGIQIHGIEDSLHVEAVQCFGPGETPEGFDTTQLIFDGQVPISLFAAPLKLGGILEKAFARFLASRGFTVTRPEQT